MAGEGVLIVGGGLAGLRAAVEVASLKVPVSVLSKVHPLRSHSGEAQGGINAALGNNPAGADDTTERHAYDTVKGSDFLADQDAAEIMAQEAPGLIYELEHWGCPFSRTPEGKIAQRPFGGAGFPRTCYGADKTGHYLLHTTYEQCIRLGVRFYEEWFALSLVRDNSGCRGVVVLDLRDGKVSFLAARAVIFATGGSGRIYGRTSNALISTGLGVAIPYRAGIPLKDMEFVQFHPTTIHGKNILMTEGARGEGGYLINNDGERFMKRYVSEKVMELAPRDIVSRSIQTEINEGRGIGGKSYVYLDIRHLGKAKIEERLPGIRDICLDFLGIDPIREPIPIQPGQHYTMGGIDTDVDGRTDVPGFYAAGECACVSVHGANRLGGNSLLETVVFGKRAGQAAALFAASKTSNGAQGPGTADARQIEGKLSRLQEGTGSEDPYAIKARLNEVMDERVGIFRSGADLKEGAEEIRILRDCFTRLRPVAPGQRFNFDLLWTLELEGNLEMADVIALGALARKESRGSHARRDFPKRDDANWLRHTVARATAEGPALSYKPVTITKWAPEERKY